jgi:Tol biopolymer transport system component
MKNLFICLLIIGGFFSSQSSLQAQTPQKQFQKGIIQEEGEGNLTEAIEIYNSVVNNANAERGLRAKALLHIGICYEKLGNQNARKTYQILISEYSDQKEIIAMVREKLNGLKKPTTLKKSEGIVASQVWDRSMDAYDVSPDGSYVSFIDWKDISTKIKNLRTGEVKTISEKGTWNGVYKYPDKSIFSPDSKKLAYYWYVGHDAELHVINIDGTSDKILAKGKNYSAPWPVAWSQDGKYILAIIQGKKENEMSNKLVQVTLSDGSIKVIKTYDISNTGQMDISPDNKYIVYAQLQNKNSQENDIYVLSTDGSVDRKLVGSTSDDTNPLWSQDGKGIIFRSNRYGTNDLWKLDVKDGKAIGEAKIIKANLGSRNELLGITKDESIFYSTNNLRSDIYIVKTDNLENGKPKANKISALSEKRNMSPFWSNDGRYVAYLRWSNQRDPILGFRYLLSIYDTTTKTRRNIDTDLYGYPNSSQGQWSPDGTKILINGNYKNSMKGGLFMFDINSEKYTDIQTSDVELTMKNYRYLNFSNDGKYVYYLEGNRKNINKIDIETKIETKIYSDEKIILNFKLSNDGSQIAFSYWFENNRELFTIPSNGGEKKQILKSNGDSSPIVFTWSENDKYLYYKKGKFQDLKKIMRISVYGGDPEEIIMFEDIFENGKVNKVDMLPGGKHIVTELVVGSEEQIWKLDGVFNK